MDILTESQELKEGQLDFKSMATIAKNNSNPLTKRGKEESSITYL